MVIMKGIKNSGLYALQGHTIIGNLATVVSHNKTKLWHNKLGHINEKGFHILSKHVPFKGDSISNDDF